MDKSTDKLRDHVCDKGGEGVKKSEIFMDVIDGSPLTEITRRVAGDMAQCGGGIGRAGVRARARFDHLLLLLDSHRLPVVVSLWSSSALSGVLSCHLESLLSF